MRTRRAAAQKRIGKITSIAYHRNGISGTGFWAVIFVGHADCEAGVAGRTFVATRFDHDSEQAADNRIAVLRLSDLVDGDADTAWRGDNFVAEIDKAIDDYHRDVWKVPAKAEG